MILVDLNQVLISNLMAQVRGKADVKPNKEMIRFMVLNSLRGINVKFKDEYGEMVLCSDASDPWRKDFFPNYKHSRKAQRQVVVQQLKSEIDTNQAIREDQRGYNVLACPGYPEVIQNLIDLNTDRNNTAFIIGDTPLRLQGTSTSIQNYANNTAGATDNGEDGLVSSSDFLGVFYPSGLTTDNSCLLYTSDAADE